MFNGLPPFCISFRTAICIGSSAGHCLSQPLGYHRVTFNLRMHQHFVQQERCGIGGLVGT